MKNVKKLLIALVLFGSIGLSSCNSESSSTDETEMSEELGKEYTSTYICPMHCEGSGSEEPGICPVCEMDYVMNENIESDMEEMHDHNDEEHDHEGHDHSAEDDDHSHEEHYHSQGEHDGHEH